MLNIIYSADYLFYNFGPGHSFWLQRAKVFLEKLKKTDLTDSLHQDPKTLYPGTCFPEQIGEGRGKGFNKNIIFSPGTKETEYLMALDSVLLVFKDYKPDLVCLVLGTDTYKDDPLASLCLEEGTYFKIGRRFAQFSKLAVFFAGGYSRETPDLWLRFIEGLLCR